MSHSTARQLPSTIADGDSIHLSPSDAGPAAWVRTLIYNPPPSVRPPSSPPTRIPSPSLRYQHDSVAMATMTTAEANVSSNRSFFVWLCRVHVCRRCHLKSLTVTRQVLFSRHILVLFLVDPGSRGEMEAGGGRRHVTTDRRLHCQCSEFMI